MLTSTIEPVQTMKKKFDFDLDLLTFMVNARQSPAMDYKSTEFGVDTPVVFLSESSLPSSRQYLSCDACLEVKREDNQNCSVLCCVRQLYTTICTQM